MKQLLRIATRRSPLAVWQARHVAGLLHKAHPDIETELVPLSTRGDEILDRSLAKVGGKGLFIKELEVAILADRADIAVHSMKDMPADITSGLHIAAVLKRANPFDAFVSNTFATLEDMPEGARLGTSSLRRASQMRRLRSDLQVVPLRGNVETRLGKLDDGDCDAILLAAAGLGRLGLASRISAELSPAQCLPAIGQGIIGIECRHGDALTEERLTALHNSRSGTAIAAERALGARLGGSCQSPIAGFAREDDEGWILQARVLSPDGRALVAGEQRFAAEDAATAGSSLAETLLSQGASRILEQAAAAP